MANPSKVANCCVLGDGSGPDDSAHVKRQNPFTTKKNEIMNDPQYQKEAMDPVREKATTRARRDDGNTRPLDGGAAKK